MKYIKYIVLSFTLIFISFKPATPDEGMYLLSQIENLNLIKAGLKIPVSEVYNPGGTSLIDALVRLDGCTGSFVSNEGLIITNHHCAFGAAAAISTKENNYIENGFYAEDESKEVKTSMKCKITQSYLDVSEKVLEGVLPEMSYEERMNRIKANQEDLIKEETKLNPSLVIEISEMSTGKIYTLFRYKVLTDIRLVYVPPRSVGEFGGESDNWVWPRHNADFSFVRAYENNKPFAPKKFLKINANGAKENDFAFILGYPGRTYRHQPYKFLEYQRDYTLPFIADWFEYRINAMHAWAGNDASRQILIASYVKRLANTSKNFRGKIQGLRRTNVIAEKYDENEKLKSFVKSSPNLKSQYGGIIERIDSLYDINLKYAERDMILSQLNASVSVLFAANFINSVNSNLKDIKGSSLKKANLESNKDKLSSTFHASYRIYSPEMDEAYLKHLLLKLNQLSYDLRPDFIKKISGLDGDVKKIEKFVSALYKKSKLKDKDKTNALFESNLSKFFSQKEPMMKFAEAVSNESSTYLTELSKRNEIINTMMPRFTEIKMKFYDNTFIPDANSTLRLTYGYIKGYSPEDAVYYAPFTYLKGVLEKASSSGDYFLQDNIRQQYATIQPSDVLIDKKKNDVAVGILYNMDTTGGNSGSPILDANGNLIGVNFDRAFTATINDYAWNEKYSRSIGVDIRYVLYVMKYIGKTDRLIDEVGVKL